MENMEQVRLFIEHNNLKLEYNRVIFEASVTYCDISTNETETMQVFIDENNMPKIQLLSETWDSTKIPLEYSYLYGMGFLGAVPSLLPIGFIDSMRVFFKKISISNLIEEVEGKSLGATILGDFYASFGWISILLLPIFGMLLMRLLVTTNKSNAAYIHANYFSMMYIFLNLVRASFYEVLRPAFYIYIIPLIIMSFLNIKRAYRGNDNQMD